MERCGSISKSSADGKYGRVVELVDSLDSGSSVHCGRAGSSPASPTKKKRHPIGCLFFFCAEFDAAIQFAEGDGDLFPIGDLSGTCEVLWAYEMKRYSPLLICCRKRDFTQYDEFVWSE